MAEKTVDLQWCNGDYSLALCSVVYYVLAQEG